MKKVIKIIKIILSVIVVVVLGCLVYMGIPVKNLDENALTSTAKVTVTEEDGTIFFDGYGDDTLLIYYPGGRVEYEAYSGLMKEIASKGVDCVIVKMPLNCSLFGINLADKVLENTDYKHYYCGGHSLGGEGLSFYLENNSDRFEGVIYTGSYPFNDLSGKNLRVLSIRGSLDGLVTEERIDSSKNLLPEDTVYMEIEGGNHAQFGTYGAQSGDNEATITTDEQIGIAADMIIEFISNK